MKNYILGFPRIGEQRELKKALESFWKGEIKFSELKEVGKTLRERHWQYQKDAGIDCLSVNDFSFYDNMLDAMFVLGAIPRRFRDIKDKTARYFAMARGDETHTAMEMTKWFNTNYHYIVPELSYYDRPRLDPSKIIQEYKEASEFDLPIKINFIGIITFLKLSKRIDVLKDPLELFDKYLSVYVQLIRELGKLNKNKVIIQFDEPILSTNVSGRELSLLKIAYTKLARTRKNVKIIVATYFEHSVEATKVLVRTPIIGLALDFVHGKKNMESLELIRDFNKKLLVGIVNGRNIWINDIQESLNLLKKISEIVPKENIRIGTSSSLLHVPYTLKYEEKMDPEIKSWLAYSLEKLDEVNLISKLFAGEELNEVEQKLLDANVLANKNRKESKKINDPRVQARVTNFRLEKRVPFAERVKKQHDKFKYPKLATTTIGSFPQTAEVRKVRRDFKNGNISAEEYNKFLKAEIKKAIKFQEVIGLDVLVHGEFERNDMVEYFGEQLNGFAFSQNGWVQSYGSRCVKPPHIYGDVSRPKPMTVEWIKYAQSLTKKPVKGMLTGPVTILAWSFVRDDQPRSATSRQIALAIRDEILDLEEAGIEMIQVDEAAFKEGYPLKKADIKEYERWAVEDFLVATSGVKETTQIHTHMCYSDFNNIIKTIERMDADVISIETSRSGNELLNVFKRIGYKQEIGPGVYDIHSPRIPSVDEIIRQIELLLEVLPAEQLWINPDCGLKTRNWDEVEPSLQNMVEAVKIVRENLENQIEEENNSEEEVQE
jgi:5-methyltetrahydropteroyltriglutamate--homocysteine methyltransferase